MIKIEIVTTEVKVKSGTSQKTGKPYSIREQAAYLHTEQFRYPQSFVLSLDNDIAPYPAGFYTIADNSFAISRFGQLSVFPKLVPTK